MWVNREEQRQSHQGTELRELWNPLPWAKWCGVCAIYWHMFVQLSYLFLGFAWMKMWLPFRS
jgi:hypothetical protein